jgi:hypothetical protein
MSFHLELQHYTTKSRNALTTNPRQAPKLGCECSAALLDETGTVLEAEPKAVALVELG